MSLTEGGSCRGENEQDLKVFCGGDRLLSLFLTPQAKLKAMESPRFASELPGAGQVHCCLGIRSTFAKQSFHVHSAPQMTPL